MILLSDILGHKFKEDLCNENLVSLRKLNCVVIDETMSQVSSKSKYFCYVRESVYSMLNSASSLLPDNCQFLIKEGYRPASIQQDSFDRIFKRYKTNSPGLDDRVILKRVSEYVAPLGVAGHPTGGAIDITLIVNGEEAFMGTRFNDEPSETNNRTYMSSLDIGKEEKENRKVLSEALSAVGFINYPAEWWHWSFGDKYWACITNNPVKYCTILDNEIRNLTHASTL